MTACSQHDTLRMARALYLAAQPLNACDPNPRVGCVIDRGGEIVGEGWHERAGAAHAEVVALQAAGERAHDATAYVTLEPCCHAGRTGPCTDALIAAGVARVVYAVNDPNPAVSGAGAARLRAAGIDVQAGPLAAQAQSLNRGFLSRHRRGRPFVLSKIAASLDGRTALANGESQWITGEPARADVQQLRARASAIVTGIGTVLADDPRLTVRLDGDGRWQPPARVVVDSRLRTPPDASLFAGPGRVIVATAAAPGAARAQRLEKAGAELLRVPASGGRVDLGALLDALGAREFNEVLVEAGPRLNGALLDARLLDELVVYQAPVVLGADARAMFASAPLASMEQRPTFDIVSTRRVGADWRLRLRPVHGQPADASV